MVIVFTADIKDSPGFVELNMLFDYVIPSVIGDSITIIAEFDKFPTIVGIVLIILLMSPVKKWIVKITRKHGK